MKNTIVLLLGVVTFFGPAGAAQSQYLIPSGTGLFAPSFRDLSNTDAGGSTYFGWSSGTFDGGTNNELLENPAPSLGVGGLDGSLDQLGTADILASSNNIYNGSNGRNETLVLNLPTNGVAGPGGFTTLIIQGLTTSAAGFGDPSALLTNLPVFASINGVAPDFVFGLNASGFGQWWAKYELPGNQASYAVSFSVNNAGGPTLPLSISRLEVDSLYSSTGYATDTAAVPEPSTALLIFLALGLAYGLRRRLSPAR